MVFIENPDPFGGILMVCFVFVPLAILFGAIGWTIRTMPLKKWKPHLQQCHTPYDVEKPHPQAGLISVYLGIIAAGCIFAPAISFIPTLAGYDRLELSNDGKVVTVHFPMFYSPRTLPVSQLKLLLVQEEWVPHGRSHDYWMRVVPETTNGERFMPNWDFRLYPHETTSKDFEDLVAFVNNANRLGLPVKITYKDSAGKVRDIASLAAHPD